MTKKVVLLLILMTSCAVFGQGKIGTGNTLLVECKATLDDGILKTPDVFTGWNSGYCLGLVRGVWAVLEVSNLLNTPDDSTTGQMVRVVVKYLNEHPEKLAEHDTLLVMQALMTAFPKKI